MVFVWWQQSRSWPRWMHVGVKLLMVAMCGESDRREAREAVFDCGVLRLVGAC